MEKNYFFSITLFITQFVFAQTYTENFDSCTSCTQEFDLTSESTPSGFWNGSADDSFGEGWTIKSGLTTSSFCTGPDGSNSGSYYAYTETSSGAGSRTFILESDGFSGDVTEFSFYYHMYGAHIGTLTAESSSNSGTDWTAQLTLGSSGQTHTDNDDDWTQATVSVPSGTNKLRIKYVGGGSYCGDAAIDDIVVTISTGPSISTGSAITGLDYTLSDGGPSTSQSTTVSGSSLTDDITITAPTYFEISSDNSTFSSSLTLSQTGGSVSSTPIYVRLMDGYPVSSYSGNITCSSTSATNQTISLSGNITNSDGSGSTLNITSSGGSYTTEKWVNITTGINGTGTQVWGQGNGTYGNSPGLINEDIDIAAGTYYVNAYDKYADSWEGTILTVTVGGVEVVNESPNDGTDNDSTSAWGNTQAQELEGSYQIVLAAAQSSVNVWEGSTDNDWGTASNWSKNSVPTASETPVIADVDNQLIISSDDGSSGAVSLEKLTLLINAEVIVNQGCSLSISGDYNNTGGTLTLKTGASMTVDGNSTGDITYTRSIGTTNWYLISSPVTGQDIDAFASASNLATGTQQSNMGLGDYNNSTNDWSYYQSDASGTGVFASGDARAIKLANPGDISFTGNIDVDDSGVGIAITTSTNGYNLIGNPYPSYIAANNSGNATNNILKVNDTDNDYLTEATIWFFNQSTASYDQINHASSGMHIAPGQGFFVSSNGSNSFSFTEAMQSNQSSDTFQRLSPRPEIELTLSDGSLIRNTDIFYIEGTTTGFDNGYDSTLFGGSTNSFEIYTHLVSDSQGQDFGIQSLPDNNFENMVIPVGVNALSGTDITISAFASNLPAGISLFLEDKTDDSFTLLDEESNYSTTLESDVQGIGRYYLHTTSQSLDAASVALNNNISVYKSSEKNLRIVGVQSGMANIYLYNTIGKQVLEASFMGSAVNDIELPELSRGVYIVKLSTLNGVFNKKIIF